jgi:small neutral amino acid transporter SnatA (MarC family)
MSSKLADSPMVRRTLFALVTLFALLCMCTGCDSAGVFDIVLGSLRLAGGIVDVAT